MTSREGGSKTQELKARLHSTTDAVQGRYQRFGPVLRAAWVVAAFVVLIAGLAMLVVPGPAIIVIPVGVAMLAARFRWAQALLQATIEHGVTLQRRMSKASPALKLATTLAGAAAAAAIAFLVLR